MVMKRPLMKKAASSEVSLMSLSMRSEEALARHLEYLSQARSEGSKG
jgi:hypothetical protein